jgi:DNA-binding NarL/FixJ family response regulator
MSLDLEHANIAVLSTHGYRAESVALAVAQRTGCKAQAFTRFDAADLAGFETVLVETNAGLEPALDWVRRIVNWHPHAKVVLLGLLESEQGVLRLAEAGASGYVGPAASLPELIATLQAVHKGEFKCSPHITYALFSHLAHLAGGRSSVGPKSPVLTMRERNIVELLSRHLTNKEIATNLCISEYTAKNHVQRILKKLGLHSRSLASRSPIFRWPVTSRQGLDDAAPAASA